jgi:uncharacterized protein YidB (DUF937 family)
MGLLDEMLGQLAGGVSGRSTTGPRREAGMGSVMAALLPVVLGMLASRQAGQAPARGDADIGGGLGGLLDQFRRAGFGEQASSWVGTGPNRPISSDAVEKTFGRDGVAAIARRAGVSEQDASRGLSELMPEVVDRVTPNGQLPDAASLLATVDSLIHRLGSR